MNRVQLAELGSFLVVGCSAVATDFCVYFLCTRAGVATGIAKTGSFAAGAVVSFVFNRLFTFKARGKVHRHALAFAVLYLLTLGLNVAVNALALRIGLPKGLAWLAATGASTVANYVGMKFAVFKSGPRRTLGEST